MSSCVFVKQLVQHVLNNPKHYSGPHNFSQPRTSQGLAALDTTRQMMLIWDAMSAHMLEQMESGKSVNVPNFGTFTFEPLVVQSDPSNPKARSEVKLRPCFVVHASLKEALYRYPGKEEIRTGPNEGSIFQQARRVVFLNEVPIAAGCYYKTDVIKSATKALFSAVVDLAKRDYNLSLDFGGITVNIQNRNLSVKYANSLTRTVQESTGRAKPAPLSDTWRSGSMSNTMLNFIERPKSPEMVAMRNRTATLQVLSLDMNSCVKAQ